MLQLSVGTEREAQVVSGRWDRDTLADADCTISAGKSRAQAKRDLRSGFQEPFGNGRAVLKWSGRKWRTHFTDVVIHGEVTDTLVPVDLGFGGAGGNAQKKKHN